jgi:hypothetical protein
LRVKIPVSEPRTEVGSLLTEQGLALVVRVALWKREMWGHWSRLQPPKGPKRKINADSAASSLAVDSTGVWSDKASLSSSGRGGRSRGRGTGE